jgi:hypothetical protein
MTYLPSSNNPDVVSQTADFCLNNHSHHTHEEDDFAVFTFSEKIYINSATCSGLIITKLPLHNNYFASVWQPPKNS